jgi:pimeloyl-ACP methyl ester carboxylesterase
LSEPPIVLRRINDLQVAVCVAGEGKPVLALHGWGGDIHSFWPVAERLISLGYQVHLLDLPGFGQTDLPNGTWGIDDYAQFVMDYLDNQNLDKVAVLGHSFGGRIGLKLAGDHPDRVEKMVLADSAGIRTPLGWQHRLRSILTRTVRQILTLLGLKTLRTRLQERYNQRYASDDYLNAGPLRDTFVRVINEDLTDCARRVQAPTVLIWGDQDDDTPLWHGRRLEELIPDAGLIVFEGAGHFAYLERLSDFVRIVDHFLSH